MQTALEGLDAAGIPPEALLAHGRALRSLALGLLGDAHQAEDAVQETWVRALQQSPEVSSHPGAWLRAVLASVARKRRRADARRRRREELVARPEAETGCDELAERRRILRAVTEAVLALEEPYQSAILLRYFEDLGPAEIARRQVVPVATVKSRLQRGLAKLRARLDAEREGNERHWAVGLASLTGIAPPLATAPSTTVAIGALVMTKKLVLASVGGALALLALLLALSVLVLAPDEEAERLAALESAAIARADTAEEAEGDDGPAATSPEQSAARESTVLAEPTPGASAPAELFRHRFALELVVTDGLDNPLEGASVYLGPLQHPLNHAGHTDAEGRLRVEWGARSRRMSIALLAHHGTWGSSGLRRIELREGSERIALALRPPVRTLEGSGALPRLREIEVPPRAPALSFDERRLATFVESELEGASFANLESLGYISDSSPREEARSRPQGRVTVEGFVSEGAQPIRMLYVSAVDRNGDLRTAMCEERGAYRLEGLAPGALLLRAGGGDHGRATRTVNVVDGETIAWNPELDRGRELRGVLQNEHGEPLAGWLVEIESAAKYSPFADATQSAGDGAFAIPNVLADVLRLAAIAPDAGHRLPALTLDRVLPGLQAVTVVVRDDELRFAALSVELLDADGTPAKDAELRLWQAETGRGAWLRPDDAPGRYRIDRVPPGRYELECTAGRSGWKVERLHLGPDEQAELRSLRLDPPAQLVFEAPPAGAQLASPLHLLRRRDDVDSRIETFRGAPARELELPAGDYVLATERGVVLELSLAPGESARVSLPTRGADAGEPGTRAQRASDE